jgi:hypothetical protein
MIRKEMAKDNVMFIFVVLSGLITCFLSRHHDKTMEKDWKLYIAHDYDDNYKSQAKPKMI